MHVVGIDEAGRGPLAGPVSVAAVCVPEDFNPTSPRLRGASKNFFKGIKDSKKLSEDERELWFTLAMEAKRKKHLDFSVVLVSEKIIDKKGITYAIRLGIKRCLDRLNVDPEDTQIFLDGGIVAPNEYLHQLTVIKGDEKIPVISLASIIAKVVRDRRMVKLAKTYPEYGFERHKGYGTVVHKEALMKHGKTNIHRESFLKNFDK